MRGNAPGRFRHGAHGPSGRTNGYGNWWEPDMFPLYDLLDDPPTLREVRDLRAKRASLPTNTVAGFKLLATGGVCTTEKVYKLSLFRHRLDFNGKSYYHAAVVRSPAYGSVPPANGEYPILLLLHGNTTDPMYRNKITDWDKLLEANKFYTDQCVVVFPLYFGYRMELPEYNSYGEACTQKLIEAGYPKFNGQAFETMPVDDELFKSDYLEDGFTADDVQIMAILQAVTAVQQQSQAFGVTLNGDIGLLGGSLGAAMVYKVAPVLHDNGAPGTLKASVALYGGTDQYAPFNVRRAKRWLGSALYFRRQDPIYGSVIDRGRSYSDILLNQKRRLESEGVVEYILGRSDPTHYVPPDLKQILRRWFLEDSVARYWRYDSGPYPLQIHHGVFDDTVRLDNSRWLAKVMKLQEVPFDADHFLYFETPTGEHKPGSLSNASRVAMATVLLNTMGY